MFSLNNTFKKEILFHGDDNHFHELFNHSLKCHYERLSFSLAQAIPISHESVKAYLQEQDFEQLISGTGLKKGRSLFGHYVNASNLKVYFIPFSNARQITNQLLIIAFGETHPGHFVVETEALLEKT